MIKKKIILSYIFAILLKYVASIFLILSVFRISKLSVSLLPFLVGDNHSMCRCLRGIANR